MNQIKILSIDYRLSKLKNVWKLFEDIGIEIMNIKSDNNVYKNCKLFIPDIIVLNSDILDSDFFQLVLIIRSFDFKIPIILVSSLKKESFCMKALKGGIDICVTKGDSNELFLLEIRSIIKVLVRYKFNCVNNIKLGETSFYNIIKRELCVDSVLHKLTPLEGRLFNVLCNNLNKVTYRNILLLAGWESDCVQYELQLNKYIVKFRNFLLADVSIRLITIKGFGYCLEII